MPCCFSTKHHQWKRGEVGLRDYWFGEINESYQDDFFAGGINSGCGAPGTCGTRINKHIPPPIYDYDWNVGEDRLEHALDPDSYPRVLEFEISNLCNMACPMCFGELSSKHMLGRDKDLKIYKPNMFDDDKNLNQLLLELEEFIPHLKIIRFTGGEPFAHKAFYKIAQLIADLNPIMEVDITTNGSIYNTKVDKFLGLLKNTKISVSLDTVNKNDYKQIRIGGKHEETLANIQKFKEKLGSSNIKINSTLMSINCLNIDTFFQYAIDNNFEAFVNGYDRRGREHTADWNVNSVSITERTKVIDKLRILLKNKSMSSGFEENIKKAIVLLDDSYNVVDAVAGQII